VTIFKISKIFEGILNDKQLFEGTMILGGKNAIDIIYIYRNRTKFFQVYIVYKYLKGLQNN
jgi:hypothetical protein